MSETSRSERTEPSDPKRKINLILTIILFAIIFLFLWKDDSKSVLLDFQDTALTLNAPADDAFSVTIPYAGIQSVDLISELAFGRCTDGVDLEDRKNGSWENSAYGDYTLCVYANVPVYIVLHTAQGVTVFNYESESTTQQLYEALLPYLAQNGGPAA